MWYNKSAQKNRAYKHGIIAGGIFLIVLVFPMMSFAAFNSTKPIGAKIVLANTNSGKPNQSLYLTVVCDGARDWMMLNPTGNTGGGPGIYFVSNTNRKGPMKPSDSFKNKYLVGLIKTQKDTKTCKNPQSGAPVDSYEITMYGF
jgi:hypothetical protein